MRQNFGQDHGYGVGTIDGFRANAIGANNHSLVFDGCVSCKRTGRDNCTACRKSLQLRGTNWKVLLQDGASHSDAEMAAGTRVVVENEGYGIAKIDGFRHNMVGANNHSCVFEGCDSCARSGAKHCTRCRKSLQLRGTRWRILPDLPQRAALAREAPRWVEDEEQECCQLCDEEFGMLNRQHHCRYCGWLVCSECSPEGQLMDVDRWVSSTEGHPVKHAAPGEVKQKRVCSSCFLNAVVEVEQRMGAAAAAVAEGMVGFVSEEGVPPGAGGQ